MSILSFGTPHENSERVNKGQSLLELHDNYIVIDLETTGLDPHWDTIIEIAAIRIEDNKIIDQFEQLVNPGYEIDDFISQLTGITNEMLATAPFISEVLPDFIKFIGEDIIVGHNANFDINFLYDHCQSLLLQPFSNSFIDTMRMSRRLFREHSHHRLIDLLMRFSIGESVKHRSLSDTVLAQKCYEYMKQYIIKNGIDVTTLYPKIKKAWSAKEIKANKSEFDEDSLLYGKQFVFTGTLERMKRKEAMQVVVDKGGICGDNVSKSTNYLVLGNNDYCTTIKGGKSNKQKKAEKLKLSGVDIETISENIFHEMLKEE